MCLYITECVVGIWTEELFLATTRHRRGIYCAGMNWKDESVEFKYTLWCALLLSRNSSSFPEIIVRFWWNSDILSVKCRDGIQNGGRSENSTHVWAFLYMTELSKLGIKLRPFNTDVCYGWGDEDVLKRKRVASSVEPWCWCCPPIFLP